MNANNPYAKTARLFECALERTQPRPGRSIRHIHVTELEKTRLRKDKAKKQKEGKKKKN